MTRTPTTDVCLLPVRSLLLPQHSPEAPAGKEADFSLQGLVLSLALLQPHRAVARQGVAAG